MPDNIPPEIGIPLAAVLWLIVIIMFLRERKQRRSK